MLTKIDLCSIALLKLGEEPVQSLSDDTASARLARTLFDPVIDGLISAHPWRFATRNFDLSKTIDGDFQIPSDVIRILKCPGRIIGNRVIATGETIHLLATARVAPENFPGYFVSLAATKLAMEFCIPLTGDQTVFRMLAALYETELQSARFIDSSAAAATDIGAFSLIDARF